MKLTSEQKREQAGYLLAAETPKLTPAQKREQAVKTNPDLAMPEGLCWRGQKAWRAIIDFLIKRELTHTGGCTAFYSPKVWAARGEEYGRDSLLIVVYDGGEVGYAFDYDRASEVRYEPLEAMMKALKPKGLYSECCTGWYSAVYAA